MSFYALQNGILFQSELNVYNIKRCNGLKIQRDESTYIIKAGISGNKTWINYQI